MAGVPSGSFPGKGKDPAEVLKPGAVEDTVEFLSFIESQFKEMDMIFNKEEFLKQLESLNYFQIKKSIKLLLHIMNVSGDFSVKREVASILRHLHERNTLICLADDLELFKEVEKEGLSSDKLVVSAMTSASVGAKKIAEYLFDKYELCNPQKNENMISYAISSQDTEWVLHLIGKWAIDITIPRYCFSFYVDRYSNSVLKNLLETKESKNSPEKSLFFHKKS